MKPPVDYLLESLGTSATLCLLLLSFCYEKTERRRRIFSILFALLAAFSVGNYFDFAGVRIHRNEQFHFFLGSKYLPEIRYDKIYQATLVAAEEQGLLPEDDFNYRDPLTFRLRRTPLHPRVAQEIRARFTSERWDEFRHDVRQLFHPYVMTDHGNTGSPAWAMTASLFTRSVTLDRSSQLVLASADVCLLFAFFAMVGWVFGGRALALTMVVGLSVPEVYRYIGGSILRVDWLCALGLSVCLFEKRQIRTAGVLLGYAVASKFLAGLMVLPLGMGFVIQAIRERRIDRDHCRYVAFAVVGLGLFVVLSGLFFGDIELWRDYLRRMLVTFHENYYAGQHSFRDLFLQAVHLPASVLHPLPAVIASASPNTEIADVRVGFVIVQLLLLVGLGFVAARNPLRIAFALGPLAVFTVLVTNRYYWQMWLVSAMVLAVTYRKNVRHTAFLAAILAWLAAGHAIRLTSYPFAKGGYFGSYLLFWIGAVLVTVEVICWLRTRNRQKFQLPTGR